MQRQKQILCFRRNLILAQVIYADIQKQFIKSCLQLEVLALESLFVLFSQL